MMTSAYLLLFRRIGSATGVVIATADYYPLLPGPSIHFAMLQGPTTFSPEIEGPTTEYPNV